MPTMWFCTHHLLIIPNPPGNTQSQLIPLITHFTIEKNKVQRG